MHLAKLSSASLCCSLTGGLPASGLPSGWQVFSALWNAGPLNEMPLIVTVELPGETLTVIPPPGPESGKFGTPWARMHLAAASAVLPEPLVADGVRCDEPHAATAMVLVAP